MTHRRAPRPAVGALREALRRSAPNTALAAVQSVWAEAVGESVAAVTVPSSERGGTLVIICSDPIWAQELELMQEQLLERLREHLGETTPKKLRFRAGELTN